MTDKLRIGYNKSTIVEITESMLAKNVGSGDTEVLATPVLLNLIEILCSKMISENLDSENTMTSVGTLANLKHMAPTPCDMKITIKSTIIGIDRRNITFLIEAFDEKELIAKGIHERVIVNRDNFNKKAAVKQSVLQNK